MTVGVVDPNPLVSKRALIRIEEIEVEDSPFLTDDKQPQMQFPTLLKVLKGAGERDGETFREFFTFPASGRIKSTTKTGQLVRSALRGEDQAENLEELADALKGKLFVSEIGVSKNGEYSRTVHDTFAPAPASKKQEPEPEPEPDDPDDDEDDFSDIPF